MLPDLHEKFVKRIVHTHGNELLENRRMIASMDAGVTVDDPLMLREKLKVMAANKSSSFFSISHTYIIFTSLACVFILINAHSNMAFKYETEVHVL